MVTKPIFAHKCKKVFDIINMVSTYIFWPHLWPSAGRCITKDGGRIYRDCTKDCEPIHRSKIL